MIDLKRKSGAVCVILIGALAYFRPAYAVASPRVCYASSSFRSVDHIVFPREFAARMEILLNEASSAHDLSDAGLIAELDSSQIRVYGASFASIDNQMLASLKGLVDAAVRLAHSNVIAAGGARDTRPYEVAYAVLRFLQRSFRPCVINDAERSAVVSAAAEVANALYVHWRVPRAIRIEAFRFFTGRAREYPTVIAGWFVESDALQRREEERESAIRARATGR